MNLHAKIFEKLVLLLTLLFSLSSTLIAQASEHATTAESLHNPTAWHNVYPYGEASFVGDEIRLMSIKNWFYLTKKAYSDFILEAEILMPDVQEYSNSGFLFRADVAEATAEKHAYAFGYQAEVDPSERRWSGGLYEQGTERKWLFPLHPERSAPGEKFKKNLSPDWSEEKANAYRHLEWNRYKVQAIGSEIKIWVNGILTTHVIDENLQSGYIGIQHHGSKAFVDSGNTSNTVRFRNIRVREVN